MKKINFKKLSWPGSSRMNLLSEALTERELLKLLKFFADRSENDRIIRLPRQAMIVKSIVFFYMEMVTAKKMSKIRAISEMKLKLGSFCPQWWQIKKIYQQRRKEIIEGRIL